MFNLSEFGKRFKRIRVSQGFTQKDIAVLIGVNPPQVSDIEAGKASLKPEKLWNLYSNIKNNRGEHCNIIWLVTGEGDMFISVHHMSQSDIIELIEERFTALENKLDKVLNDRI